MLVRSRAVAAAAAVFWLAALPCPAPSCSMCNNPQAPTLREEARQPSARIILVGTLENARLNADGSGATDLRITDVLRKDAWLAGRRVVELPKYLAVSDSKNPPRFLVFCDLFKDRLDPYRGMPVRAPESVEYVRKAMALDPADRARNLLFYFGYLENADPEVARDAFLEFAKASDAEIARVAPKLSADRLRACLRNPQTPQERLGLYAAMLGACGTAPDADLLAAMLHDGTERSTAAYDGLLAGYTRLRPRDGWQLVVQSLQDGKRPLPVRLAVIRAVRFFEGANPAESRSDVLRAMGAVLRQGELADIGVEDLRRWKLWDLTPDVLGLYGKKGYDAPIMQRAVVRYALSCKERDDARAFVADRRKAEPDLVQEVSESLEYEKGK